MPHCFFLGGFMTTTRTNLKPHHADMLYRAYLLHFTDVFTEQRFQNWSPEAAAGSLGYLTKCGFLYSFSVLPGVCGYRNTQAGCNYIDVSVVHARLLGQQAIVSHCIIGHDCARRRKLPLTQQEIADRWQELLPYSGFSGRIVPGQNFPVAIVKVDYASDPRRIPSRCRKLLSQFARDPEAGRLLRKGLLGCRLLVPTVAKAEAVARELERAVVMPGQVEIEVAEELTHLLF
jgi:hypothetical protein